MRMDEDEMAWFRFRYAGGRCEWCGADVEWDLRGRPSRGESLDGHWELHHHPHSSRLDDAFGSARDEIYPDIPLNLRIICWDCHRTPHGRHVPIDPLDPFR